MARKIRDDILQIWGQGDNDLDRFIGNCQKLCAIYDAANKQYGPRYKTFLLAVSNFAILAGKLQLSWRKLKNKQL